MELDKLEQALHASYSYHNTSSIPRPISSLAKQYRCDAGKITRVTNFMGAIRFKCDDENGRFDECLFFLSSYRLKPVRTLCQIFTVGDWVAFVALKFDGGHWTAMDVRPREEMLYGYGQFWRIPSKENPSTVEIIIRPQFRTPFSGGDVAFYKRSFRKGHKTFEQLVDGEWLRFLALEKPDKSLANPCTAVAVEVEVPLLIGLVVKRSKEILQIWCKEVGLTTAHVDLSSTLTIGSWVRFRLGAQKAKDGQWKAFDVTTTSQPADVLVKIGRHIRVTALAVAGVLSSRYGTCWSEKLGRMTFWRWCLKNVDIKPHQRLIVRAFYNKNDERRMDTQGDAWTVYELKAAPVPPKISPFAPSPSIIYNAHAVVEDICMTPKKWYATSTLPPCFWRLRSEKYGNIFARPVDVLPMITETGRVITAHLRPGDKVKISLVPVSLSNVDEYRAFVVEKLSPQLMSS